MLTLLLTNVGSGLVLVLVWSFQEPICFSMGMRATVESHALVTVCKCFFVLDQCFGAILEPVFLTGSHFLAAGT